MRPAMHQTITLSVPKLDAKGNVVRDKYSKPITTESSYPCRTRVHGEERQNTQLRIADARDEIDVMPDVPVQETMSVTYTTITGETKHGIIQAIAETTNLTASKIYFRTLVING